MNKEGLTPIILSSIVQDVIRGTGSFNLKGLNYCLNQYFVKQEEIRKIYEILEKLPISQLESKEQLKEFIMYNNELQILFNARESVDLLNLMKKK